MGGRKSAVFVKSRVGVGVGIGARVGARARVVEVTAVGATVVGVTATRAGVTAKPCSGWQIHCEMVQCRSVCMVERFRTCSMAVRY